jgi:multiple sugar transport system substrate-binding protein
MHGAAPHTHPNYQDPVPSDMEMAMMQWENIRAVEERFNVVIEHQMLAGGDFSTFAELFLAQQMVGDPIGEIVLLHGEMLLAALQNPVQNLTDLSTLQFPGSDLHGSQTYIVATFEQDGSIYQVSPNIGGSPWATEGLGVNMELIERLNLPNPMELYERGEWNWDNFLNIMRLAQAQGYFGISGIKLNIAASLMMANDGMMVTPDMNYGFDHPNSLEALELFGTIIEERLWMYDRNGFDPFWGDYGDGAWSAIHESFLHGESVFFHMWLWSPAGQMENFRVLPYPMGPRNTSGNTWGGGLEQAVVIPAGVEDPLLVLQVLEALTQWPAGETWMLLEGPLGNARGVFQTEECAQRWIHIGANQRASDIGYAMPGEEFRYIFGPLAEAIFFGENTVAGFIEQERGPRQAVLDDIFR